MAWVRHPRACNTAIACCKQCVSTGVPQNTVGPSAEVRPPFSPDTRRGCARARRAWLPMDSELPRES
eukprot:7745128-Alexandrium_andersonii.AAC.1